MESLLELVKVVNKNRIKGIRILDHQNRNDLVYDFYSKLTKKEFESDSQASEFYFKEHPSHYGYRKLKAKLRSQLYNTLFFIDTSSSKFNEHQRAFYQCQKNLITVKILLGRYARKSAMELVRNTLKFSTKYEFTEISLELYRYVRNHHAIHTGNKKKYLAACDQVERYEMIKAAEELADKYYEDVIIDAANMISSNSNSLQQKVSRYISKLNKLSKTVDSFRFNLLRFFLAIQETEIQKNYQKRIRVAEAAIKFFSSKDFVSNQFIGSFYYHQLISYTQLKKFEEGKIVAARCRDLFEAGTVRWFNANEHAFTLFMHTRNYHEALETLKMTVSNKFFEHQFQNKIEIWKVKQAYIYLLYLMKKITLEDDFLRSFRLRKFLNEVPVFSMDKRGHNIPILIVQILITIFQGKFDQVADRTEAIEKYTSRYLKKDKHFRTNCFIKMLLQVPKHRFHKTAVIRHTKKYRSQLDTMPLEIANQSHEIEIIPYEHLWEYTLESLDNKFR